MSYHVTDPTPIIAIVTLLSDYYKKRDKQSVDINWLAICLVGSDPFSKRFQAHICYDWHWYYMANIHTVLPLYTQ